MKGPKLYPERLGVPPWMTGKDHVERREGEYESREAQAHKPMHEHVAVQTHAG